MSYSSPFFTLNDVNLDVIPREYLGITGNSGTGKTTLPNVISGVSKLTSREAFDARIMLQRNLI